MILSEIALHNQNSSISYPPELKSAEIYAVNANVVITGDANHRMVIINAPPLQKKTTALPEPKKKVLHLAFQHALLKEKPLRSRDAVNDMYITHCSNRWVITNRDKVVALLAGPHVKFKNTAILASLASTLNPSYSGFKKSGPEFYLGNNSIPGLMKGFRIRPPPLLVA